MFVGSFRLSPIVSDFSDCFVPDRIARYQKQKKGNNDPQSPVLIAWPDWIASPDWIDPQTPDPIDTFFKKNKRTPHALDQTKAAFCLVQSIGVDRIPLEVHRGHGSLHRSY
jgi:hypothetical protein